MYYYHQIVLKFSTDLILSAFMVLWYVHWYNNCASDDDHEALFIWSGPLALSTLTALTCTCAMHLLFIAVLSAIVLKCEHVYQTVLLCSNLQ